MPEMTLDGPAFAEKKGPEAEGKPGQQERPGGAARKGAARAQARDLKGGKKKDKDAAGGDAGEELDFEGDSGALDPTMRKQAEKSLGVDLGGVKVHQGEKADSANKELGAKAFTHGQDIVLGGGVKNDVNPIVAHELAHTVQQKGGAEGVAKKSDRGSQGSGHEVDADQAASLIMIGAPAKVAQTGSEQVMCFEGAEHMGLGNAAWGGRTATVGRVTLPAGAFTAIQGDFFGTFEEMERACNDKPKMMYDYYDLLVREGKLRDAHQRGEGPEPDSNGAIMVASAANGRNPMDYLGLASTNFNHFSEQNAVGNALFDKVLAENPAYAGEVAAAKGKFGHNIGQWLDMHMGAAKQAFKDGLDGKDLSGRGIAMDAAGMHYLTDAFAAGHMRVPRLEMYNEYQATFRAAGHKKVDSIVNLIPNTLDLVAIGLASVGGSVGSWISDQLPASAHPIISLAGVKAAIKAKLNPVMDTIGNKLGETIAGFSAKVLHDFDNEHGVKVHNDAGQKWTAMGDHALTASKENEQMAIKCTTASAAHVQAMNAAGKEKSATAKKGGSPPQMPFKSLKSITNYIPQLDKETKNEGSEPGGPRDWHWKSMSAAYRAKIKENGIDSITGTVGSATSAIKEKVKEAVAQKVREALAALGRIGSALADKVDAIVEKILDYIPTIDPTVLINELMSIR